MPTVNIFYKDLQHEPPLQSLADELKSYIAEELTCGEIKLEQNEVSIRFLKVGGELIGSVEVEIVAHSFAERISRQDDICLEIADYMEKTAPSLGKVKVWLLLTELGHSIIGKNRL
jgi:hypothetical protein